MNAIAPTDLHRQVEDLIFREALLLDRRNWDDWLDLYAEDCVYWMPSWCSEDELTDDPEVELNYFYITSRGGLQDRVFRFASGDSYASAPLSVTSHVVGTVMVEGENEQGISACANWICVTLDARRGPVMRGGRYEYLLRRTPTGLRIARKKIILLDQQIDGTVDVYNV
jgi:benzoate/toluate 1,2-dioxygenase beta subunit